MIFQRPIPSEKARTLCDSSRTARFHSDNAWLDCLMKFILQCNIEVPTYPGPNKGGPMSEDWNTKYGPRRVRRDPPTLEEAIFAAVGITDDQEAQAEIAASLMGMPYETVLAEVKKLAR